MKLIKNLRELVLNYPYISCFICGLFLHNSFNEQNQFIWIVLGIEVLIFLLGSGYNAFLSGYLFGLGYFSSTIFWIVNSFGCVGMGALGYIVFILLSSYMALYPALTAYVSMKLSKNITSLCIIFPIVWTLFEMLRGFGTYSFGWNPLAIAFLNVPYMCQIADILGIYGVTLLMLLCITLLNVRWIISAGLIALSISYGWYKVNIYEYTIPQKTNTVVMIQPAISQEDKLNHKLFWDHLAWQIELTHSAKTQGVKTHSVKTHIETPAKLIIWPEAAVNNVMTGQLAQYIAEQVFEIESKLDGFVPDKSVPDKSVLITGTDCTSVINTSVNNTGANHNTENYYNSAVAISSNGKILQRYDKKILVPFGEFIPEWLFKIGGQSIASGMINFKPGTKSNIMHLDNFEPFDILICYEIIFQNCIRQSCTRQNCVRQKNCARQSCNQRDCNQDYNNQDFDPQNQNYKNCEPTWILNITNDAWFKCDDEAYQHLQLTRFRAIESGRSIARCNNSGISCIIDCNGRVIKQIKHNHVGVITAQMPLKYCSTLFATYGNKILFMIIFVVIIALAICKQFKNVL